MKTTLQLLAILKDSLLLSDADLARLRQLYDNAPSEFTPRVMMKWLHQSGRLTTEQIERLLQFEPGETPTTAAPSTDASEEDTADDLTLAPLDEDQSEVVDSGDSTPPPELPPDTAPQPVQAAITQGGGGFDALFDELFAEDALAAESPRPLALKTRRGGRAPTWDSPLMLIGGGILLGLAILGAALVWALNRQTGDEALRLAEADYRDGSYGQAIHKYDVYLRKHPRHVGTSLARVHRGLARLRLVTETTNNWPKTLQTANEVLDEISSEAEFHNAHGDLAALLPAIAQGLAEQANQQNDPLRVGQAREALAMIEDYVPLSLQPKPKMEELSKLLALVDTRLAAGKSLARAVGAIQLAAAEGRPGDAYSICRQLLDDHPNLAGHEQLTAAMLAVATAQRRAATHVDRAQGPEETAPPSPLKATLTLAQSSGGTAAGVEGKVIYALAQGAAYGLDASTGRVLWRYPVGFDAGVLPIPLTGASGGDVLLLDPLRGELVRLDGTRGEIRWRHLLTEPCNAAPLLVGNRAIVAGRGGRLLEVELATGNSPGYIQLPQPLRVGAVADVRQRVYYQLGDHSNLYVLAADTGECLEVVYLGHGPDSIAAEPLVVGPYLIVVENNRAAGCTLRVLRTNEQGIGLQEVQQFSLAGRVHGTPQSSGRILLVATDRGALHWFEVKAAPDGAALVEVDKKPAQEKQSPVIQYLALRGSELWIGGTGLTKYQLRPSQSRLLPVWIKDQPDVFLQPPHLAGDVVFCVRRRASLPGVTVAALDANQGEPIWETHLAVPLTPLAPAAAAPDGLSVLSASGALLDVAANELSGWQTKSQPVATVTLSRGVSPADGPIALEEGRWAYAVGPPGANQANAALGARQVLVVEPPSATQRLRWLELPDELSAAPVAFLRGLAVPLRIGQVVVLDPVSGKNLVEPFQPRLVGGGPLAWSPPAAFGEDELLVSDGRGKLYRLGVAQKPIPHLEARSETELASPLEGPIAVLGPTAYAVDTTGQLLSFHLPDLTPADEWPLGGSPAWGPRRVGRYVLLATTSGELLCLDDGGQLIWKQPLPHGPLAGTPLAGGSELIIACRGGIVYRVAADTGKELALIDVGQPLGAGPLAWGDQLLLTGYDGCLHVTAPP